MSPSKSNKLGTNLTYILNWAKFYLTWDHFNIPTHWAKFLIWDINSIHLKLDQDVFCEHSFLGCLSLSLEVPGTTE